MKCFVIFLFLVGFAGFIPTIHAEFDKSIAEPFKNNDVVIIGKVIQVNTLVSENQTEYNIQVEEYLKGQKPFEMITAVLDQTKPDDFPNDPLDYYNKPFFEKENQVFVYLKQEGGTYKMSPYSFTIKKPTVAGPPTVIHPTGPQGHIIPQGDEIVISGTVKKGYLYGLGKSNLDSSFNLVILNEKDELVESEKITILPDGSYMFSFQNEGEVRIPGKYSWEIKYWNGGMGGEFIVETVPSLWTPLKQTKSGVTIDEIDCKDGLILIQKYDGSPACVKPETKQKLIERGWTIPQSNVSIPDETTLIERYKDIPEVKAFYSKYDDADVEVRDGHLSYFAGNEVDFRVRMNLYIDENDKLDHIDFHCYIGREHQTEVPQNFILKYLKEYDCEKNTKPLSTLKPITATNVIDANNQFALDFYLQLTADKKENVFFSPWSISTAFSIAYEGARGTTAEEIRDAFGFIADDEERRSAFSFIQEDLNQKDAKYKLNTANALWLAPDFEPFPEYVSTARNYYSSEVDTVNFAKDGVDIINEWVNAKTEGKIEELFEPGSLDARTRLVITNAIYFNGTWVFPFDKELTADEDFFVTAQKTVSVPMMSHKDSLLLNYTETEEIGILELPYEGDKLSMIILLPHQIDGITSLEESLSAENISEWRDKLVERKVRVKLPKFTMETDYDLVPELKEMGISAAFGPADFSGISNTGLFIDQAIHKAFVDVNEVGTEAAAATGISMEESGPQVIRADHPFMFLIQDNETGNILFIGKVVDPSQ